MLDSIKFESNTKSAISLQHLGIDTYVLTTMGEMEAIKKSLEETPDSVWCNGLGKDFLYKMLLEKLRVQDKYFTENIKKVSVNNPKWLDFCNDCLILYVLDAMRNNNIYRLLHPKQYKELMINNPYKGTNGEIPDMIDGIPTLQ